MATKTCTSCRSVFRDRGQQQCPRCGASLGEEPIVPLDAPDIEVSVDVEQAEPDVAPPTPPPPREVEVIAPPARASAAAAAAAAPPQPEPPPKPTLSELSLMDPGDAEDPVTAVVAQARCPTCRSNIPPGNRWCPVCHFNIVDPHIGKLASPLRRLAAYALDYLIPLFILLSGSTVGFLGDLDIPGLSGLSSGVAALILLVYAVVAIILFSRGTTPGKIVLGMWVVQESGARAGFWRMLCREWIGKVISAFAVGLGFIWILIDAENQGWHDMLVSTHVVQPAARR